jgi:hydroxypyruvate isomerase
MPRRHHPESSLTRRQAVAAGAAAVAGVTLGPGARDALATATTHLTDPTMRHAAIGTGRLQQSVARWCFSRMPIDDLCAAAKTLGMAAIDLLGEEEWSAPRRHGLACAIGNSFGTIPRGFNRPDLHDELVAAGSAMIPKAAAAGVTKLVVFSGNRGGMSDGEGIANCITGLRRLMPVAERHGVTLCMEMLNSKVDHRDYHADHTAWAVEVAKGVDSPRFRLLYDIYHMQVMEGDVIATIRAALPWIAHFHTAGVPGRHELDATQELNYPAIARVIADAGFTGYVAHEFLPTRDPLASLREAVERCTV